MRGNEESCEERGSEDGLILGQDSKDREVMFPTPNPSAFLGKGESFGGDNLRGTCQGSTHEFELWADHSQYAASGAGIPREVESGKKRGHSMSFDSITCSNMVRWADAGARTDTPECDDEDEDENAFFDYCDLEAETEEVDREIQRSLSMSDLVGLEAAVSDIEDKFLEVKEMVDCDVIMLVDELDLDADRLEAVAEGVYANLIDIAEEFLELTIDDDHHMGKSLGVMRRCRDLASELSAVINTWDDSWLLPNYYLKLLFIVSRCSRLAYCMEPLDPVIHERLQNLQSCNRKWRNWTCGMGYSSANVSSTSSYTAPDIAPLDQIASSPPISTLSASFKSPALFLSNPAFLHSGKTSLALCAAAKRMSNSNPSSRPDSPISRGSPKIGHQDSANFFKSSFHRLPRPSAGQSSSSTGSPSRGALPGGQCSPFSRASSDYMHSSDVTSNSNNHQLTTCNDRLKTVCEQIQVLIGDSMSHTEGAGMTRQTSSPEVLPLSRHLNGDLSPHLRSKEALGSSSKEERKGSPELCPSPLEVIRKDSVGEIHRFSVDQRRVIPSGTHSPRMSWTMDDRGNTSPMSAYNSLGLEVFHSSPLTPETSVNGALSPLVIHHDIVAASFCEESSLQSPSDASPVEKSYNLKAGAQESAHIRVLQRSVSDLPTKREPDANVKEPTSSSGDGARQSVSKNPGGQDPKYSSERRRDWKSHAKGSAESVLPLTGQQSDSVVLRIFFDLATLAQSANTTKLIQYLLESIQPFGGHSGLLGEYNLRLSILFHEKLSLLLDAESSQKANNWKKGEVRNDAIGSPRSSQLMKTTSRGKLGRFRSGDQSPRSRGVSPMGMRKRSASPDPSRSSTISPLGSRTSFLSTPDIADESKTNDSPTHLFDVLTSSDDNRLKMSKMALSAKSPSFHFKETAVKTDYSFPKIYTRSLEASASDSQPEFPGETENHEAQTNEAQAFRDLMGGVRSALEKSPELGSSKSPPDALRKSPGLGPPISQAKTPGCTSPISPSHGAYKSPKSGSMISPALGAKSLPKTKFPAVRSKVGIQDFETVKPISKGAFGIVYLCKHKETGEFYAVKVLKKSDVRRKNQFKYVVSEKSIMAAVDCPFVVKLICSFQTRENLYLVMEYVQGGDCYTLLQEIGALPEDWVRQYMAEMVLALEYLHIKRIVHRDLKPDNILINADGHLKLTDFGLSNMGLMDKSELSALATPSQSRCGPSPHFGYRTAPHEHTATPSRRTASWQEYRNMSPVRRLASSSQDVPGSPFRSLASSEQRTSSPRWLSAGSQGLRPDEGRENAHVEHTRVQRRSILKKDCDQGIGDWPSTFSSPSLCGRMRPSPGSRKSPGERVTHLSPSGSSERQSVPLIGEDCDDNIDDDSNVRHVRDISEGIKDSATTSIDVSTKAYFQRTCSDDRLQRKRFYSRPDASMEKSEAMKGRWIARLSSNKGECRGVVESGDHSTKSRSRFNSFDPAGKCLLKPFASSSNTSGQEGRLFARSSSSPDTVREKRHVRLEPAYLKKEKFEQRYDSSSKLYKARMSKKNGVRPPKRLTKIGIIDACSSGGSDDDDQGETMREFSVMSTLRTGSSDTVPKAPLSHPLTTDTVTRASLRDSGDFGRTPTASDFVRSRAVDAGSSRVRKREDVVGTPEYLSPEILLGQEHSHTVDWWALGVIMFEFMFGLPPFTGDTPEKVFESILSAQLPWHLGTEAGIEVSDDAKDFIRKLLVRDPKKRLGYRSIMEVKQHPFFKDVCWDLVIHGEPVFVPQLDDPYDTSYFDAHKERRPSLAAIIAGQGQGGHDPLKESQDPETAQTESTQSKHTLERSISADDESRSEYSDFDFTNPAFLREGKAARTRDSEQD